MSVLSSQTIPRSASKYAWYVASILCLGQITANLDRYLLSVLLEPLKADLRLSDTQLGLLQGPSFVLLFALFSIPMGRLADSWNRRLVIAIGLVGWSIATVACGLAASFGQLFAARLMVGMGEAALVPAAMSLIAAYFPREQMNRGVALFASGGSLGHATAFLGGGALLTLLAARAVPLIGSLHPWQALLITAGAIGILVAALVFTIREPSRDATNGKQAPTFANAIAYFWERRGAYLPLFISFSMVGVTVQSLATWSVSFLVRQHGLAVGTAGVLFGSVSLVAGPAGALTGGWLTDRLDVAGVRAPHLLIIASTLALAPIFAASMWQAPTLAGAIACYIAIYFTMLMCGAPGYGGVQAVTPDRFRGVMVSLFLCTQIAIGAGLGPLLVGVLSDRLYPGGHRLGESMLTTICIAAIIGAPLAFAARSRFAAARIAIA